MQATEAALPESALIETTATRVGATGLGAVRTAGARKRGDYWPGVSVRLVAALFMIALLPLAGAVSGILGQAAVEAPLARIAGSALYFAERDQRYRRALGDLGRLVASDEALADRATFERTRGHAAAAMATMRGTLEELVARGIVQPGDTLRGGQRGTELAVASALQLAEQRFAAREQLAGALGGTDAAVVAAELRLGDGPGTARTVLDGFVALATLARRLAHGESAGDADALRSAVGARLQALTAAIAALPPAAPRDELAGLSLDIANRFNGAAGLFAARARLDGLEDRLARKRAELGVRHAVLVERLGVLGDANVAAAHADVRQAQVAASRSGLVSLASAAMCLLATLAVLYFYVGRSLLRRLRYAAGAAVRVSAGNFASPITVEGDDEIAQVTAAVEELRTTKESLRTAEHELRKCQRSLHAAIDERDGFAAAAAQDLLAPLAALEDMARSVSDHYGDVDDATLQAQLRLVNGRVARLQALAAGLKEYALAGQAPEVPEAVDVQTLLRSGVDALRPEDARVTIAGAQATITTWRASLEQVVRHLVDNAFRHHDRDAPALTVDVTVQHRNLRLMVADDGPGISRRAQRRVLQMLHTGKPRDVQPGCGMGLAIVHKILLACGGSLRIESDPAIGRGSKFIVTWPVHAD